MKKVFVFAAFVFGVACLLVLLVGKATSCFKELDVEHDYDQYDL